MLPEWERLLSSAARLQRIVPGGVLVGGTAAALHAGHRISKDADHVLGDLRTRFDRILAELESVAGWKTARKHRPVLILGSLDGIDTGVRQLIRTVPLETTVVEGPGGSLVIPTYAEILRIKGVLALRRNATRDYLDFAALSDGLGGDRTARAFDRFDSLYPQENGQSALQQLLVQLASPRPFDLSEQTLSEYANLDPRWHEWQAVEAACADAAMAMFDRASRLGRQRPEDPSPNNARK